MRNEITRKHKLQLRRKLRVRKKLHGTELRPRLNVIKSNKHIHVQLIDDDKGHTIAYASTASKKYASTEFCKKSKESAKKLGDEIASLAKQQHIKEIIFDRGPYKYHGILAELANAARESGLIF